jgi:hypothetical protein
VAFGAGRLMVSHPTASPPPRNRRSNLTFELFRKPSTFRRGAHGGAILCRSCGVQHFDDPFAQNMIFARNSPVTTDTAVATIPGIMNEWLSTYLPIFVVPERSKLIAAISEPYVGMKK